MKTGIFCMMTLVFVSCHDTISSVKGCCNEAPQYAQFDSWRVLIPNIFTPNDDGVHDHWIIYGDSAVIKEIRVWNDLNVLVYAAQELPLQKQIATWDGSYQGQVIPGMYEYEIIIETMGQEDHTFKGRVCNFICEPYPVEIGFDPIYCVFQDDDPDYIDEFISEPCFE